MSLCNGVSLPTSGFGGSESRVSFGDNPKGDGTFQNRRSRSTSWRSTARSTDANGSLSSPWWDTATEGLTNAKLLSKRVGFDTNSTIDPATGMWKTTGDGGAGGEPRRGHRSVRIRLRGELLP